MSTHESTSVAATLVGATVPEPAAVPTVEVEMDGPQTKTVAVPADSVVPCGTDLATTMVAEELEGNGEAVAGVTVIELHVQLPEKGKEPIVLPVSPKSLNQHHRDMFLLFLLTESGSPCSCHVLARIASPRCSCCQPTACKTCGNTCRINPRPSPTRRFTSSLMERGEFCPQCDLSAQCVLISRDSSNWCGKAQS
jgi:hypothetical protein